MTVEERAIEEMTERSEKIGIGSYAYRIGKYEVIAMANGRWHLYLDGQATGRDYRRLTDARRAIKNEEAKSQETKSQEARSEKGE